MPKQSSSFTTTLLVNGGGTLVQGTDVNGVYGQTVVDSSQWEEIKADQNFSAAAADFDKAVDKFFAPILKAAEKLEAKIEVNTTPDPISYIVLKEPVEGVAPEAGDLRRLTRDSMVLRLIESGNTDRLVWVDGNLEVTAVLA